MQDTGTSSCTAAQWHSAPATHRIEGDEVHVWRIDLGDLQHDYDSLRSLLSADEKKRADRFLRAAHGQDFTVARGVLRRLLASYTGGDAQALSFEYNEFGKPGLRLSDNPHHLSFNISHTGSHCVIALCSHRSVGIDIERYRPTLELEKLAQRYFATAEIEALMVLAEAQREKAFYRCWSSKEAFMKVVGEGLSVGLGKFEVEVNPDGPTGLKRIPDRLQSQGPWSSIELPMGERLSGVVMVEGELGTLRLYRYAP